MSFNFNVAATERLKGDMALSYLLIATIDNKVGGSIEGDPLSTIMVEFAERQGGRKTFHVFTILAWSRSNLFGRFEARFSPKGEFIAWQDTSPA